MNVSSAAKASLKRIAVIALGGALALAASFAANAQALHLQPPYDTSGPKDIQLWPHSGEIIADAEARAKKLDKDGAVWTDGRDTYRTELGGSTYYIATNGYLVLTHQDRAEMTATSTKLYPGYCVFYIYNKNLQFESSHTVQVGDGHAGTNCNTVLGVSGVAFHGKPALLAIVQYFYTDGKAASSIAQIGASWIQTAVLLPLAQQPDGKWVFTQDFSCFPPTNTIKTLVHAKTHLATCH